MRETLEQIIQLRGKYIDIGKVDQNPHHVHLREDFGFKFTDARSVRAATFYAGFLLAHRLGHGWPDRYPREHRELTDFAKLFGIHGPAEVRVSSENRPKMVIFPHYNSPLWNPRSLTAIFPEVDYKIEFRFADLGVDSARRDLNSESIYIFVNTTKKGKYSKAHLIGFPQEGDRFVQMVDGEQYYSRIDKRLKDKGYKDGAESLVPVPKSRALITSLQEAVTPLAA